MSEATPLTPEQELQKIRELCQKFPTPYNQWKLRQLERRLRNSNQSSIESSANKGELSPSSPPILIAPPPPPPRGAVLIPSALSPQLPLSPPSSQGKDEEGEGDEDLSDATSYDASTFAGASMISVTTAPLVLGVCRETSTESGEGNILGVLVL